MCLLIAGVLAVALSLQLARRTSGAQLGTAEEILSKVTALNERAQYGDALELLLKASRVYAGNSEIKSAIEKTFLMYVQSEIIQGSERVTRNKKDENGYATIAHAYQLMNEPGRALEVLTTGVMENPNSVKLWSGIGVLELARKRDAEALAVFKEVLRLDAQNATALNNSAYIQSTSADTRLINMNEALAFATKSVDMEPANANFLDTLAVIRYKRGEIEEAKRLIQKAIVLEPDEGFYKAELKRFENAEP